MGNQPAKGGKPNGAAQPAQQPQQQQPQAHAPPQAAGGQQAPAQQAPAQAPQPQQGGGKQAVPDNDKGKKLSVDDFELLKVVGKGSFGKVMQVQKKDNGRIYAMKVLKKQHLVARKQVAHTQTERKVLENIDHPFIVSLRYAFQTDDKLYMILDYFTGGELFFHLKNTGRFSEKRAKYYAAEITLALECLHSNNIVYRDLKPENVLLDEDGHIRLTDFGLSKESIAGDQLTHTFCGTPEYLAPEVIHGSGYGKAVDWWSLGTLLYEMLTGLPPFYNQNLHVMYEKIIRGKLTFPPYLSADAKSLLTGLLNRNPAQRLGSGDHDADDIKNHPFFKDIDFKKLYNKEIPPPFKPNVKDGDKDTSNVDDEFKREIPKDTPAAPASNLAKQPKVVFAGFTYRPTPSEQQGGVNLAEEHDDEDDD